MSNHFIGNHQSQQFIVNGNPSFIHNNVNDNQMNIISSQIVVPAVNLNNESLIQQNQQPSGLNLVANQPQQANNNNVIHYQTFNPQFSSIGQVNYSNENTIIQGQQQPRNMSQTAQIVLVPTQNINISSNVVQQQPPKQQPDSQQQQVQMILPNNVDGLGYQITAFPNVSVLVPTTILITDKNECILIPQNTQDLPLQDSQQHLLQQTSNSQLINTSSSTDSSFANVDYEEDCPQSFTQEQPCEFITLANNETQTVIADVVNPVPSPNQQPQPQQLIGNNCQIVGIIETNQIGVLQNNVDSNQQPMLLTACIQTPSSVVGDQPLQNQDDEQGFDLPSNLISSSSSTTLSTTIPTVDQEKPTDPDQAKEWLKDSCIVNRALKALNKVNNNTNQQQESKSSHNRPHSQQWR